MRETIRIRGSAATLHGERMARSSIANEEIVSLVSGPFVF
jgi:hypothetical protein